MFRWAVLTGYFFRYFYSFTPPHILYPFSPSPSLSSSPSLTSPSRRLSLPASRHPPDSQPLRLNISPSISQHLRLSASLPLPRNISTSSHLSAPPSLSISASTSLHPSHSFSVSPSGLTTLRVENAVSPCKNFWTNNDTGQKCG